MTFSKEWNSVYEKNLQRNNWPFSDLISYTIKYSKINKKKIRVLELGCGTGPNIPFFISNNSEYFGLDGSTSVINQLKKKYPKIKNNLVACDFTHEIPFRKTFDLVIDRSSLTHNSTFDIKNCLELIHQKLNSDGKFIGIDWFSTNHFEYKNGKKVNDPFTKNKFKTGQFKKIGNVHFSNKQHLQKLLNHFKIEILNEKIIKNKMSSTEKNIALWNFVAKKK